MRSVVLIPIAAVILAFVLRVQPPETATVSPRAKQLDPTLQLPRL